MKNIFVGNLDFSTGEDELSSHASQSGAPAWISDLAEVPGAIHGE